MVTNFNDIKDALIKATEEPNYREIEIGFGKEKETIRVLQYLPIDGKANLVQYVVNAAVDNNTGCFSPIRVNVYYAIGLLRSYCGIHFDELQDVAQAYDLLENTGILNKVMMAIPEDERTYMETLINDTIKDISRYNNSFAGMISAMSGDAADLGTAIEDILEKIRNKDGMEFLGQIRTAVGTD